MYTYNYVTDNHVHCTLYVYFHITLRGVTVIVNEMNESRVIAKRPL